MGPLRGEGPLLLSPNDLGVVFDWASAIVVLSQERSLLSLLNDQ